MEKAHKNLDAWKLSMALVLLIYRATERFPEKEQYGLTSQIRRSAVSIPSNIAEGAARQTKKEFANYLHISRGSLSELDTQLELSRNLGFLSPEDWESMQSQIERIDKVINGLIRHRSNL